MSWGKFEWIKELKKRPKYAEIVQVFHEEISKKGEIVRKRGFLVTEARTE